MSQFPPPSSLPFWIVWCPNAGAPSRMHPSEQDASDEAYRLSKMHPDRVFTVLRSQFDIRQVYVETRPYKVVHGGQP